nr:lipase member H-like [Halyomorpha halys]
MLLYRVAEYAGMTILKILDEGVSEIDKIHVIGHSLGAHVAGLIGGYVRSAGRGLVARVTGLDPAKPLFEMIRGEDSRLDQGDGKFVDVIHTCIGLSYAENLGHVDFYPNGGYCTQPGCVSYINPVSTAGCAHAKAYHWYIDSIYHRKAFPAVKCDTYVTYELGKCDDNELAYMGAYTSHKARGSYYLTTNNNTSNEANDVETSTLYNQ